MASHEAGGIDGTSEQRQPQEEERGSQQPDAEEAGYARGEVKSQKSRDSS